MAEMIEHTGQIISLHNDMAKVRITQLSACASCHAKGGCSAADSAEKEVDAFIGNQQLGVGQFVIVAGRTSLGMQAVLIAYLLPFLLMLFTLIFTMHYFDNEPFAAGLSLAVLVPFYVLLYFFRNKLKKNFSFFIKQII